jgi:hypothetical protein
MAMTARAERIERAERADRSGRADRATTVRSRVHGGSEVRALVKVTAPVAHVATRAPLQLVPRRRRAARLIAAGFAVVFVLMLGAAAFQTQLARRQLTLDTLDRRISAAHEQYDVLRRQRAELRSPGRLAEEAAKLGMVPARQTQFVSLDPDVVATVQRAGAPTSNADAPTVDDEFKAYATVKAKAGGAP